MNIQKTKENSSLWVALEGRMDTITAPTVEKEIMDSIEGITELHLDFEKLAYISSAGLRVLLSTQKRMQKQGKMVLHHVNEAVMEILDITGFVDILTIE